MNNFSKIALNNFRNYLKINTVHPDPLYAPAVVFLKHLAQDIGLPFKEVELHPGKPICWMTWRGTKPALPSVLLNSHMDVVPVFPEYWKYDPFSAHLDENGNIYARGAQDIKCLGIQYLEAIRRLKHDGIKPTRTVHVLFVPDEEIGGKLGMALFVKDKSFQELNVGFGIDEASASPDKEFYVYYAERSTWWTKITCRGQTGHGSQFVPNNVGEKIRRVINSFLAFRDEEEKKFQNDPRGAVSVGHYTSVNLTILEGGVQSNVLPEEMSAVFDIRVAPTTDLKDFEKQVQQWCEEAGENVEYSFISRSDKLHSTSIDPDDPWWKAFSGTFERLKLPILPRISQGGTDAAYLREVNVPMLGFSPMNNTTPLLHHHNEYLNQDIFLRGIDIFYELIPALSSVPEH